MSLNPATTERAITPHLALIAVQIMFGTWAIFGKIVLQSGRAGALGVTQRCAPAGQPGWGA